MSPRGLAYALITTLVLGMSLECVAGAPKRAIEGLGVRIPVELTAEVRWERCGTWNGFYYAGAPGQDFIVLCEENLGLRPGAARVLFLHELGHAYAFEYGLVADRWGGAWEDQADEFASIMTLVQGRPEDLLDMADAWDTYYRKVGTLSGDTHSPANVRAQRIRKMYSGYRHENLADYLYFKEALEFWRLQFLKA